MLGRLGPKSSRGADISAGLRRGSGRSLPSLPVTLKDIGGFEGALAAPGRIPRGSFRGALRHLSVSPRSLSAPPRARGARPAAPVLQRAGTRAVSGSVPSALPQPRAPPTPVNDRYPGREAAPRELQPPPRAQPLTRRSQEQKRRSSSGGAARRPRGTERSLPSVPRQRRRASRSRCGARSAGPRSRRGTQAVAAPATRRVRSHRGAPARGSAAPRSYLGGAAPEPRPAAAAAAPGSWAQPRRPAGRPTEGGPGHYPGAAAGPALRSGRSGRAGGGLCRRGRPSGLWRRERGPPAVRAGGEGQGRAPRAGRGTLASYGASPGGSEGRTDVPMCGITFQPRRAAALLAQSGDICSGSSRPSSDLEAV